MKLTIVIPALNEEEAIGSTVEQCLAARDAIVDRSPVEAVEIIVVSDGSTDRTAEIAAGYEGVRVIVFEQNRGYGAAIKRGFEEGVGELVGFLDADGTCDPNVFATLCTAVVDENAAVALGSRLGPGSHMPAVRRLGNRAYALILSALANRVVTDTASGMRVLRRDALWQLYPLPDGLHFTPAMSARVLMDDRLRIVECPMPYEERVGTSKLHVFRDGLRFLRIILEMSLMWRPAKLFLAASAVCLAVMIVLVLHPVETWIRSGQLQEDMIYRLLFCSLLGTFGVTLLSSGVLCNHLHGALGNRAHHEGAPRTFCMHLLDRMYSFRGLAVALVPSAPLLIWLVGQGAWTRFAYGHIDLHWSRIVLAGLVVFGVGQLFITILIVNLVRFHVARDTLQRKLATEPQSAADAASVTVAVAPPHGLRQSGEVGEEFALS